MTREELHQFISKGNKEKTLAVGMTGTFKPRIFDRVEFIEKNLIPIVT